MGLVRNASTVIQNRRMLGAYARWMLKPTVELPWGASVSGFRHFSEFWGAINNAPSDNEIRFIMQALSDRGVALDVGANLGVFTSLMASQASVVHAFEPSPDTFNILSRTVAGASNVVLNNSAISDTAGIVAFIDNPGSPAESKLATGVNQKTVTVRTDTIDDYCAERSIEQIALLKIDVEGAETRVLMGAKRMLSNTRYIFIEIIQNNLKEMRSSAEELIDLLSSTGYKIQRLSAHNFAAHLLCTS